MTLADKGQQVMFAHGVELDIFYHNHLIAVGIKQGAVDNIFQRLGVTTGNELESFGSAFGGFQQAIPLQVFADGFDDGGESVGHGAEGGSVAALFGIVGGGHGKLLASGGVYNERSQV